MKQYLSNRWVTIIGVVVLVVAAYGAVGHWLLPWWLESFVPGKVEALTGRKAQVADISINPFTLEISVTGFKLMGPEGRQPALNIGNLYVNASVTSVFHLGVVADEIRVDQPVLAFARTQSGRYSFADVLEHYAKVTRDSTSASVPFALYNISLTHGRIDFDDQVAGRQHHISDLGVGVPFISNLAHDVDVFVTPSLSALIDGSSLKVDGRSKPFAKTHTTEVELNLDALDIPAYVGLLPGKLPYLPTSGKLSSTLVLSFNQGQDGRSHLRLKGRASVAGLTVVPASHAASIKVGNISLQIHDSELLAQHFNLDQMDIEKLTIALKGQQEPALAIAGIRLGKSSYTGATKTLQASTLSLTAPQLRLSRDKQGNFDLVTALLPPASTSASTTGSGNAPAVNATSKPPDASPGLAVADAKAGGGDGIAGAFHARLDAFNLTGGQLRFTDTSTGTQPVKLELNNVTASAKNITTAKGAQVPVSLSMEQGGGTLALDGTVELLPLQLQLNTHIQDFDLAPLQGYLASMLNVNVERMDLGSQGKLEVSQTQNQDWKLAYKGDVAVSQLAVRDKLTGQPFLNWKSLQIDKLTFSYPSADAAFAVSTGGIDLSDFYARVILNSDARLNVMDVVAASGKGAKAPVSVTTPNNSKTKPEPKASDTQTNTGPAPRIELGPIKLSKGRVSYTDHYVKPHYSANLLDLAGSIGAMSSDKAESTPVDLQGRLDSGGSVAIKGQVSPLAKPLALDLSADAKGIELTRLSPYSAKYVGYNIDKGKLSVNVHYTLQDQKLQAENHVFLDQLTFGDQVDSPDALKLPVRLAVSLLKDSKGQININMPVSGSLSDPKFSIGGVLMHAFVNLVGKALTSPFKLLASVLGSGAEKLSYIDFKPGSAELDAAAKAKLDKLAKLLKDRSSLQMDIAGRVDPATDPDGLRHVLLERNVKLAKIKDDGGNSADVSKVTLSKNEYDDYLQDLYNSADFDKPQNFLGFTKSQSPEKMTELLVANMQLPDDAMTQLANSRAQAALDYLTGEARIERERLFLTAPHLKAKGAKDKGSLSRADFSLK